MKCDWCESTVSISEINGKKACVEHIDQAMKEVFAPVKEAIHALWTPPLPLRCAACGRTPTEIGYDLFKDEFETADHYVWANEGTLDKQTGLFLDDQCYVKYGMPTTPAGWTATPANVAALLGVEL